MIPSDLRLYSPDGSIGVEPHDPAIWNFVDFDTRKWLRFQGPVEPFGNDDGESAQQVLLPVIDMLESDVTKITFTADGKRWKATKLPEDDVTPVVSYPMFTQAEVGDFAKKTLKRGMWEEIERIGPGLDVIRTRSPRASSTRSPEELFVFKYYIVPRKNAERTGWTAPFYHQALSAHQNVVPFGDFVVDESTNQLVGYTTKYIPDGSLDTRHIPIFKRNWIEQLMNLVDHINLKYGLLHQDIAPRNLVLDEKRDRMLLLDFENAVLHSSQYVVSIADDVMDLCFTIYEILTGDEEIGHDRYARKLSLIMDSGHWQLKKNIQLEPGVSTDMIKHQLKEWAQKRHKATTPLAFELQASIYCPEKRIQWVEKAVYEEYDDGSFPAYYIKEAVQGAKIVRWERPSSAQLQLYKKSKNRKRSS